MMSPDDGGRWSAKLTEIAQGPNVTSHSAMQIFRATKAGVHNVCDFKLVLKTVLDSRDELIKQWVKEVEGA
jgi:hypothetical protein